MSEVSKKVFFVTGGGTGGHIYPAIAVADALSEKAKVFYVGNKRNMEFGLATKKGYKFLHVGISGMPRKLNLKLFYWGIRLLRAILFSVRYIKKYKPNAVFATGGYVSAPMIFACIITNTPYIMHDCDAMPGLVTRRLSGKAKYVTLAFKKAKKHIFNNHAIITGNPIRNGFATMTKEEACEKLGLSLNKYVFVIIGGSQGAKSINQTAVEILRELVQVYNIQVIFQTGEKNYNEVIDKLKLVYPTWEEDKNLIVRPYFEDMISVLKSSDIVLSRAGSLSISEICASNTAPILVPYPHAAANHQRINAKCIEEAGACIYVEDKDLEPNKLIEILKLLINNPMKINYLKQNALYLAKYDATKHIVGYLSTL